MPKEHPTRDSRLRVWGVIVLSSLTGALCGFRCRCSLSKGKIKEIYTVSWLKLPEKSPGPRTRVYSPLRQRFRVAVVHEDLPPETELRVSWYYMGKGSQESSAKKKLFYVRPKVVEGSGVSVFDARSRGKVWPVGRYMARVERDKKTVGTVNFEVLSKRKVDTWLYLGEKTQPKAGVGPPWEKNKNPVFRAAGDTVALRVDIANPKPKTKMRVMWHRLKGDPESEFYSESDEILLRGSKRLYFRLPKVKGSYCPGRYRVTVRLDGKRVVEREFQVIKAKKGSQSATGG